MSAPSAPAATEVVQARARVVLDLGRQRGAGEQRPQVGAGLLEKAEAGRRHRALQQQTPLVHPAVDEEEIGRVGNLEAAAREQVRGCERASLALRAGQLVQRLGPRRPPFPGLQEDARGAVEPELRAQHALLQVCVEDLLVPAAHLHAPAVVLQCKLRAPHVAVCLRQVEDRAGIVRVAGQVALEQPDIAQQLSPPSGAVAVMLEREHRQRFLRELPVRRDVLVRRALVPPAAVAAPQANHPEVERTGLAQHVGIGAERAERTELLDCHVRVDQQQVVGGAAREAEQLRAVVPEVDPLGVVQLARHLGQRAANELAGVVGGAGVADHPVVDQPPHRCEAALDDRRLVADDHGEGDRWRAQALATSRLARSRPRRAGAAWSRR